ncbi:hypothetical protein AVEN_226845-1 [Araneus ventricosus]|uniref:Uncharacterized protein n=1 Tax=Araneus ventricosus TaxID=182803 RepID=A0A4Y2F1P0_ARAVE|nr:hypothetical protein AVEN_226845-1 [Araneus ventricosus]
MAMHMMRNLTMILSRKVRVTTSETEQVAAEDTVPPLSISPNIREKSYRSAGLKRGTVLNNKRNPCSGTAPSPLLTSLIFINPSETQSNFLGTTFIRHGWQRPG